MRKLIVIRRKIRFHQMETFIYSMRMIMLISSLKLVGHKYLDPIFVSICGLLQAFSVVFKSMKGKKKFYKVTIQDVNEQGSVKGKTMILTQKEFETRERSMSQSGVRNLRSRRPSNARITQRSSSEEQSPASDLRFNIRNLNLP